MDALDKQNRINKVVARCLRALDEEVLEELAEARSIPEDVLNDPEKLADRFLDYAAETVLISSEAETPEEAAIAAVFHLLVGIDGEAGMPYFPPCQLIPNGSDIDISGTLHHGIQQKVKELKETD